MIVKINYQPKFKFIPKNTQNFSPEQMTFRNKNKYKQTLNIEIQESPSQQDVKQQQKSLSEPSEDLDQNSQHQEQSNMQEDELDQKEIQSGESSPQNQQSEQQFQDENQIHEAHSQYQSHIQQDYLIPEQEYSPSKVLNKLKDQPLLSLKPSSLNHFQSPRQQKDPEVQKIIQDVLYKRKEKLKQKQLLQNILHSDKKSHNTSSLFRYQPTKQKALSSNPFIHKINQNINSINVNSFSLKENYELITKSKELESKIKILAKKKDNLEKERKQKQQKVLKNKERKPQTNMTKQQKSLQKLQKRLSKALELNTNLSKRVKLQKSKLNSILSLSNFTVNSKKNITASIDQQSAIRHVQNLSKFNSIDKNNITKTHRSNTDDDHISFRVAKSPSVIHESSISRDGFDSLRQGGKWNCRKCQQKSAGKNAPQNYKKSSYSPTKYKSPILQFNSYLIDSQQNSPSVESKKNIYIEDDMIEEQSENLSKEIQNEAMLLERRKKQSELKELVENFRVLGDEERQLMRKIEQNGIRIKEYENQQYLRVVQGI